MLFKYDFIILQATLSNVFKDRKHAKRKRYSQKPIDQEMKEVKTLHKIAKIEALETFFGLKTK